MRNEILRFIVRPHWRFSISLPKIALAAILMIFTLAAQAQTQIKGRVLDDQGKPLPGVSILVKGTSTSTTASNTGNFSISVPSASSVLVFSYIGFTSKEVPVRNQTEINVTLLPSAAELEQVVVVGYGTQRKEAVTGSVANISGEKVREVPAPNIAQAIQGRIAGVNISQTSTKPGATMQILIRGARSLSASNDPLVVLDGIPFPGSIGDINPNDIKSIDILKDASATAIYGSRGANGVILLTTNRGQQGAPAQVTYNSYTGLQTLFAKYPMMNSQELIALRKAAGLFTTNGVDESNDTDTDWQDLFYNKSAVVTSHDVGVSGGSATGNYSFGGGYYKNQSLIPTQQYTRYSMKASLDQQIGKLFRIGFTSNNNYNLSEGNQVGVYGVLSNTPMSNPYNADGSLKRTIRMPQDEAWINTNQSTKDLSDIWLNETRGFATYNSFYGEVKIPGVEGLKYRANLGLDFIQSNNGYYTGVGVGSTTATTVSTAGVGNSQTYHWTLENLLTYDRTFSEKHNINVVALYSAEQNKFNSSSMTARDIPSDAFQFYNLGQANGEITIGNGNYNLSGLMSYMGRVMYSYDNRYLISATLRSDGSSRLAPGHKWNTYPAVSVGWNLMNEPFMKGITAIDRLKIRVGYGQTSNQSVNPYQTLGLLNTRPYNFGDTNYAIGYYVSQLPSPNLGWEYSQTWNYGLDFSVLKNRINGTFEYYVTNTNDILLGIALPPTSGVASYTANIGQTQNKGWELSVNGNIFNNKDGWSWDVGFNLSANRNKLVSLASGQTRDEGNAWFVGYNINAIYDYEKIGLWQAGDPNLNVLEPGGNVGMIKVKYTGDYDATGKPTRAIGAADRQIMNVDPKLSGGFNTRVAYKGFDLNVVGLFKDGGILISTLYGSSGYLNLLSGRRNNVKVDYWTPENTGAKYPKPGGIASGDNPKYGSTLGYFDASFLKIRTISLGYDFNRDLIKDSKVRLRMYLTVQNPFVMFSPYYRESGMDPETNSYGDENAAVTNTYQRRFLTVGTNTPSTRNYVAGLNLTF
ncbi:TonB-linked SusC/RagA family outer membrane protein [Pedobacter psychrotolerans]|uniref:TonB-linked SusC/RagA family outer membrane protein n=2 Tax=Pedobacter psychrotolerans TaxID=1843235 RepID=A0A4R2HM17_9SPHI|nr:TonB-dependent receptor [Pedobacter psychrotolerans]TCO28815.1 TonB-linked SusC/RagA family outer membrane protein [Pedobacter psychrotolerans]